MIQSFSVPLMPFYEEDHVELAKMVMTLHERGCHIVLTNSNHPLVHELYAPFTIDVIQTKRHKFEKDVSMKWDNILNSLDVVDRSEKIFADARIGIIRLTNATPLDAQNIFSRINRGGTQLKAEELLSAKPYWNKSVNLADQAVIDRVKEMYGNLGIPAPDSIVRWDIAATFISRIKDENLIFDTYEDVRKKKEISMDEISLGFKLLSSVYAQGMSNKQVNELEQNESIKWEYDIDE